MSKKKKKGSRIIVLSSEIDNKTVGEVIEDIAEINFEDKDETEKQPIQLILNSGGGTIYDGFALIGAIEISQTPIHITILGCAMSMALLIAVSGHYRIASKYTTFMYHGGSYGMDCAKIPTHRQELKEAERLDKMYDVALLAKTKIPADVLEKAINTRSEIYWNATQAKHLGIIDKII